MITLDAIQLPDGLKWVDEFNYSPREQRLSYSVTGALLVLESVRQAGRPITLTTDTARGDAISRADLLALQSLADASAQHTLTLHDGRAFSVRWRHADAPPVEATPIVPYADPLPGDPYAVTLRFVQV